MRSLLAGLMFVCTTAGAQYVDGNTLHSDLNSDKSTLTMYSLGYVAGVADVLLFSDVLCMPVNVTQGQIKDVVKNFLDSNPQSRNLPASLLVQVALGKYWQCPANPKRNKS